MVNLYQLYFSSSHFLSQQNKKVFHPSIFPPFQLNTNEEKLNFFYPTTFPSSHNFSLFYFSTPPSKHSLEENNKETSSYSIIQMPTSPSQRHIEIQTIAIFVDSTSQPHSYSVFSVRIFEISNP